MHVGCWIIIVGGLIVCSVASALHAAPSGRESLLDHSMQWPDLEQMVQVLTLRDYNTRLVVVSTAALGLAAGWVGAFLLLRRRSLMGDALSHATLPGVAGAFLIAYALGGTGKSLPLLLLGATVTGLLGVGWVLLIRNTTRLRSDAAMGIVLSTFFGLGLTLLSLIQALPTGNQAGLQSFIYGKAAAMVQSDFHLITGTALATAVACAVLFKEFKLLCFDEGFARSQGWPVHTLDMTMMALVTAVTVIGLQAVGLILVIALLITPPAAARFWTERLGTMTLLSAAFGAVGGWVGASLSALMPKLPTGAVIVVVISAWFVLSMLLGTSRGVLVRLLGRRSLNRRIGRQHLLRAFYELSETAGMAGNPRATFAQLLAARSWSPRRLRRWLRLTRRDNLIKPTTTDAYELTDAGARAAERTVRNHRLWEMYLITHADIAPSHVDRDADLIEHVLGEAMVERLERLLRGQDDAVPASPHRLEGSP